MDATATAQPAEPSGGFGVDELNRVGLDVFEPDTNNWLNGTHCPAPFLRYPAIDYVIPAHLFNSCFLAFRWVQVAIYGFATYPFASHYRFFSPPPFNHETDSNSEYCVDEEEPTSAHLEYTQQFPVSLFYDNSRHGHPPLLPTDECDWLDDDQRPSIFGPTGRLLWVPKGWFSPRILDPSTRDYTDYSEHFITLEILRYLCKNNINLFYLRQCFWLIPDPPGKGLLSYSHPIMRRIAAIAYCVHYPSGDGLLSDVARECGRARHEQALYTYRGPGTFKAHLAYEASNSMATELRALATDTTALICEHWDTPSRLEARLLIAAHYALSFTHDQRPLAVFRDGNGYIQFQHEHTPADLVPPVAARTAYLGWVKTPHMRDEWDNHSPSQLLAERTAWTRKACNKLLKWARDTPGPAFEVKGDV